MKLIVTGGAGFIGSAFVRMLVPAGHRVLNLDKLTYAGNLDNLEPIADAPNYRFVRGDINDAELVGTLIEEEQPDAIVHFAAESHVDRSILSPSASFETNLRGTFTLLEAVRKHKVPRYVHVSTDEVYGSLDEPLEADETYPLKPSSPYSASKAGSDLLVLSYFIDLQMPVMVTRASNNYGPYQFPEKLIPLMISNALEDKSLPDLRRRPAGARLAVRGRSLPCDSGSAFRRPRRRDLQHRRQSFASESRGGENHPSGDRKARVADHESH